jgi:hypothetical protein
MSKIAQKIYELREAVMETHPKARIDCIVLNIFAEAELMRQLGPTFYELKSSPATLTQDNRKIKQIFDISLRPPK